MTPRLGALHEVGVSAREAEVLAALREHLTNVEIAAKLFISVRTVESHVSSLLRKLQVNDRRALAALPRKQPPPEGSLPTPLTPFVGRRAERSDLSAALQGHRLVTAVGPGGVGKTRLALSVADEASGRFADGTWFVDLVPVVDPAMVAPAIAEALGIGERQSSSAEDDVVGWLAGREAFLVLDNCEHLLDGVVVLLERLLAKSPRLTVLATSRARLLVPFEYVFSVPGLSISTEDGRPGDAVELFLGRAAVAGTPPGPADTERIAGICRAIDGMALAVELAAARYASMGLDGLEAGLVDRLQMLTGSPRIDDRHRSLRSTLDWSYALLDVGDQAVLRRVSTFAESFTAVAAATVLVDWEPVSVDRVASILAGLVDQSLLTAIPGASGTRYRVLETIRQYGATCLDESGESDEAALRHLNWCLGQVDAIEEFSGESGAAWRTAFDQIAAELRAALAWAIGRPEHRPLAYELSTRLASMSFLRGLPHESQRRYEQAADLAADGLAAADALRHAAGAAESRHVGNDAMTLRQRAVDAALRAGDRVGAAADLARNAELINRAPGLMSTRPVAEEASALIAQGWELADGDPAVEARLLTAEAFNGAMADPATRQLLERALTLARRVEDPFTESAALDQLTAVQLVEGDVGAAVASALRRVELLEPMPVTAVAGLELFDGLLMGADCTVAAGDLATARLMAERLRDLPFYREEGHLATARLLVVTVLAGDWSEALGLAARFRDGWERAGRPRAGNLSGAAYAAATLHGLCGDDAGRGEWLEIVRGLETPGRPVSKIHLGEFFDALLLLHRGQADQAAKLMTTPPDELNEWFSGMWRPWYAALWAEAAVLSDQPYAADRITLARLATVGNPIAAALVDRAEGLTLPADAGRDTLNAAADALLNAGSRYQWARTLALMEGAEREHGEWELATMGAEPMGAPPARD